MIEAARAAIDEGQRMKDTEQVYSSMVLKLELIGVPGWKFRLGGSFSGRGFR